MKKYIRYLSFVLAISIIFTLFSGFTNIADEDMTIPQEKIELDALEKQLAVVEEATVEYLEVDDFPAVLDKAEIQENQYVGRVKSEETNEYTLVLKNADGSNTMRLFDYPVKYTDATGTKKDITLKLHETAKGNYQTADNNIITTFAQKLSDGISLEHEDVAIKMVPEEQPILSVTPITPVVSATTTEDLSTATEQITTITPITPVRKASLSEDKEMVSYPFGNNTTLEYSLTYTGFKEDIVVEEFTGQTEYIFRLYTNGLTLIMEDGSYYLADENNEIKATIGDIIIFTADERNNTFGNMTYETVIANEEYLMTIHVDAAYLKDEKTIYPIRIDPTIEINYDSNGTGAIQDVTINSLAGSSGSSTAFMIGKRETYGISRALMRFPNLSLSNIASWSHKPGTGSVTNLDYSGQIIHDPELADRDSTDNGGGLNYSKFIGYFSVTPMGNFYQSELIISNTTDLQTNNLNSVFDTNSMETTNNIEIGMTYSQVTAILGLAIKSVSTEEIVLEYNINDELYYITYTNNEEGELVVYEIELQS